MKQVGAAALILCIIIFEKQYQFYCRYTEFPNAYSFSKNLSEQVVADFADKLPITILRPSIGK